MWAGQGSEHHSQNKVGEQERHCCTFVEHQAAGCPWLENDPCLAQFLTQKSEMFTCQFAVALFPTLLSLKFLSTSILHSQRRVLAKHFDIEHSQVLKEDGEDHGAFPSRCIYARDRGGGGSTHKSLTNFVS